MGLKFLRSLCCDFRSLDDASHHTSVKSFIAQAKRGETFLDTFTMKISQLAIKLFIFFFRVPKPFSLQWKKSFIIFAKLVALTSIRNYWSVGPPPFQSNNETNINYVSRILQTILKYDSKSLFCANYLFWCIIR